MSGAALLGLPAPAKLNLFLHVVGRRADGYHLLESVFVLVDLCDALDAELTGGAGVERAGDVVGDPERDLCVRAAQALRQEAGRACPGVRLTLTKRIPSGAGMGGGSSDAATTLLALNRLWGLGLSRERLMAIGARLGADVPFFLFGQNAFARGIGEILEPVRVPASAWCAAMPRAPVATASVFASPALRRDAPRMTTRDWELRAERQWPGIPGVNDLQAVVEPRHAGVREALAWLGPGARMTGSGAACFAPCPTIEIARQKALCPPDGLSSWALATLPAHPLQGWAFSN